MGRFHQGALGSPISPGCLCGLLLGLIEIATHAKCRRVNRGLDCANASDSGIRDDSSDRAHGHDERHQCDHGHDALKVSSTVEMVSGKPRITALKDNDTFQCRGIVRVVVRVVGMFSKPLASPWFTSRFQGHRLEASLWGEWHAATGHC